MKIEIVTTSNDQVKETGFGAFGACTNILNTLVTMGYEVRLSSCNSVRDLSGVVKRAPDLVILAVKYISTGLHGQVWLSDYFNRNRINYSGSSRETLNFDSNKALVKTFVGQLGIKTAGFFTAIPGQYITESQLPISFPLFLKPLGSIRGHGIDDFSLANNYSEFERKVSSLYKRYKQPALVEEYIEGREFTVSLINTPTGDIIASAMEIVPRESLNGLKILGAKAKKDNVEILSSIDDRDMKDKVKQLAVDVFIHLGARDFGSVDIKADMAGDCYFMGVNLVPGMTVGSSYFPKACELDYGIDYNDVVEMMMDSCLERGVIPPLNYHSNLEKFRMDTPT